jgi:hypothetical protein
MYHTLLISILIAFTTANPPIRQGRAVLYTEGEPTEFVRFRLNKQDFDLDHRMTPRPLEPSDEPEELAQQAEEESNLFLRDQHWVQIIRQDDLWLPNKGIGIGFSFDTEVDTFPYRPEKMAIQFKDFAYGGTHFSKRDTANFSGVYNQINGDLKLEILSFQDDTIQGNFSGVLLSGSGRMAHLEEGSFRVKLYRK